MHALLLLNHCFADFQALDEPLSLVGKAFPAEFSGNGQRCLIISACPIYCVQTGFEVALVITLLRKLLIYIGTIQIAVIQQLIVLDGALDGKRPVHRIGGTDQIPLTDLNLSQQIPCIENVTAVIDPVCQWQCLIDKLKCRPGLSFAVQVHACLAQQCFAFNSRCVRFPRDTHRLFVSTPGGIPALKITVAVAKLDQ